MSIIIPDAESTAPAVAESAAPEQQNVAPRYLSGRFSDVMFLGGGSIILLPLLALLPAEQWDRRIYLIAYGLTYLINSPHFAVSYQMFYSDFAGKVRGDGYDDQSLKTRYLASGVVIPIVLAVALAAPFLLGSPAVLGYGFNLMMFVVGWHYVKQGYGMAMVDAALKRQFFNDAEKKVMRVNGYALWALTWFLGQRLLERDTYIGLPVRSVHIPIGVLAVAALVALATTVATVALLAKRIRGGNGIALAGTIAYLVSLYVWLLALRVNPLFAHLIPGMHSLQYLYVVRRYQKNKEASGSTKVTWANQYLRAIVLGMVMFVVGPLFLDRTVGYDHALFGTSAFLFMFMIFINVHHYCLDNVMWRRGNPDVSKHLFAAH